MTRREDIEQVLKKKSMTVKELAQHFGVAFDEIVQDLQHIKHSVRPPFKFSFLPAQCRECGFLFKDREKLRRPSKCPTCTSPSIDEARFVIKTPDV